MLGENLTSLDANNKGADQAAHSCSVILAVVIRSIQSIKYPNWLHKKMYKGSDQTAHPYILIGAVIDHFITRVTNKIVPNRKCSFAFIVLVSLKMSFKMFMISIYVVCRQVTSCRHFICDSYAFVRTYVINNGL